MAIRRYYIIIFILMILQLDAAQADVSAGEGKISMGLFRSKTNRELYEIEKVVFIGNTKFSADELQNAISSRPSERSWQHQIFQYLSNEVGKNSSAPKIWKTNLRRAVKSYENEIRYFEPQGVREDSSSLWHFYNKRGYHDAEIDYSFSPDSQITKNVLTFYIRENQPYLLDTINYQGLDSLPQELKRDLVNLMQLRSGSSFNEDNIIAEVKLIYRFLLDNGYFFATYTDPPIVYRDTATKTDSVVVYFLPGRRQLISSISFTDSTRGQPGVSVNTKREQLEFAPGQWYSKTKVANSEENLRYLGTFEDLKIDTCTSCPGVSDSTLAFRVLTKYRKLQEANVGLFFNRTTWDNLINLGIEGTYLHRNAFGKAQVFNPYGRMVVKDISRSLENFFSNKFELEWQIGFKYGQSILWIWDNSRIGFFISPLFSYRVVDGIFPIGTFSLPVQFPVKFPPVTYINSGSIDFTFEWQRPIDFDTLRNGALEKAKDLRDSTRIRQSIFLLEILNNYSKNHSWLSPVANIIGISLIGDHRDNLFSPTKGDYAAITADIGTVIPIGVAKYARLQFAYNWFHSLNRYTVLATKVRLGAIFQWDKANSYVPVERQFFCGGANSVRGWPSRKLRFIHSNRDSITADNLVNWVEDFIGNATLVEGSGELRYRFQRTGALGNFWDEQISNMGMAVFVDVGNAFNWYAENYTPPFYYYITKLAIAAGLGFRYETPVGPFRIDFAWPLYDPNVPANNWLFQKQAGLSKFQFHIALGHAF